MIDSTSLNSVVRALENERGHGILIRGVTRMKMRKVIPMSDWGGSPVHGTVSLEVGGYRIDVEFEAGDFDFVTPGGAIIGR